MKRVPAIGFRGSEETEEKAGAVSAFLCSVAGRVAAGEREKRSSFYVVMNRSSRTVRWWLVGWLAGWVGGARCRSRDVVVRISTTTL